MRRTLYTLYALYDLIRGLQVVLRLLGVVPGGGAVEAGLSIYLEGIATTLGSREQLAIAEFAEALLSGTKKPPGITPQYRLHARTVTPCIVIPPAVSPSSPAITTTLIIANVALDVFPAQIIPRVLAVNAAKDATELVAKLRAYHHTAQTKPNKGHLSGFGLDLVKGEVRNNLEAGVLEPAMSKIKSIQFATEAALTILRIDDVIKLDKEEEEAR
eukprot:5908825-Pyramimonas_sp.AAC.1